MTPIRLVILTFCVLAIYRFVFLSICYRKSANVLIEESGCILEHPSATKFRQYVMSGDWNKADHYLQELQTMIDRKHSNIVVSSIVSNIIECNY